MVAVTYLCLCLILLAMGKLVNYMHGVVGWLSLVIWVRWRSLRAVTLQHAALQ